MRNISKTLGFHLSPTTIIIRKVGRILRTISIFAIKTQREKKNGKIHIACRVNVVIVSIELKNANVDDAAAESDGVKVKRKKNPK